MKRILLLLITILSSAHTIGDLVQFNNQRNELQVKQDSLEIFINQNIEGDKSNFYFPIAKKKVKKLTQVFSEPYAKSSFKLITKNKEVLIYDRKGNWERISIEGEAPEWVNSDDLCNLNECNDIPKLSKTIAKAPLKTASTHQSPRVENQQNNRNNTILIITKNRPKARVTDNYDYSCACSKVDYCVGPRGGHYCITSGGNKRYLSR